MPKITSKKKSEKQTALKMDILLIVTLAIISILIRLPVLNHPIDGDAVYYAVLTQNLYEGDGYVFDGNFHTQFPPGFPLVSIPAYALTKDPIIAVKITSMIFAALTTALTYLFLRKLKVKAKISAFLAATVAVNPWFVYFTSIGYSEGLGIFLLTAMFFFYYLEDANKKYKYLAAACIGFGAITRAALLPFLGVFILWEAYQVIKIKSGRSIIAIGISVIPMAIWTVLSFVKSATVAYGGYATWLSKVQNIHLNILLYIIIFVVTFIFMTPIVGSAIIALLNKLRQDTKSALKKYNKEYITLTSVALYFVLICWASFDLVHFGVIGDEGLNLLNLYVVFFSLPRYIIPLIPILTIIGFINCRKFYRKILAKTAIPLIAILFILCIMLNYGQVQDLLDSHLPIPNTIMRRNVHRMQAIDWINENAEQGSEVTSRLQEPTEIKGYMRKLNLLLAYRFREDIKFGAEEDVSENPEKAVGQYLLTEKETDIPEGFEKAFSTKNKPYVSVYVS